jgi:hypothetical protein
MGIMQAMDWTLFWQIVLLIALVTGCIGSIIATWRGNDK